MSVNQVEVKILQQSYLLGCKQGQEERLLEAVAKVDEAMTRIQDAGKVRARERIAVLAALNLAFELADLQKEQAQLVQDNAAIRQASAVDAEPAAVPAGSVASQRQVQGLIERIDRALQRGG